MKPALLVAAAIAALAPCLLPAQRSGRVRGYVRRDGSYVAPYRRTMPNATRVDNWSSRGNVNPYTGAVGTKDPYAPTYRPSAYRSLYGSAAPPRRTVPLLGKLGRTTRPATIFSRADVGAPVYYQAGASAYVIVPGRIAPRGWSRVLMSNGIDGFVQTDAIVVLPYDVEARGVPTAVAAR